MASLVSSSLKTGRFIFMRPLVSLWGHQPWHGHLEPHDLSDTEATDEEADTELLSLSNPWSDKSKGNQGEATHNSCGLQSQTQPWSWWAGWGLSLGTSHHSATTGMFAGSGHESWLWKLNGVETGGIEWGQPGPLGLMCPSVMAWAISHQPLTITQACQLGTELGWFANPSNSMWQCKCDILCFT